MAKWIGCWTQYQKFWGSIPSAGHVQIFGQTVFRTASVHPAVVAGYLVHRSNVGSIVAGCRAPTARGGIKSEEHV